MESLPRPRGHDSCTVLSLEARFVRILHIEEHESIIDHVVILSVPPTRIIPDRLQRKGMGADGRSVQRNLTLLFRSGPLVSDVPLCIAYLRLL